MITIRDSVYQAISTMLRINATSIPSNLVNLLEEKRGIERKNGHILAEQQFNLILKNLEYGKQHCLPICQDTGMINIIIQFSPKFQFFPNFSETIFQAISDSTKNIPLRPNTVDPITETNENNNLGHLTPPIYYELSSEVEFLKIYIINKGGGAENMSRLFMLNPSTEISDIKKTVVDAVKLMGGKPCPPIILGLGIGGDATYCMYLAKKALLRPLFSHNTRSDIKTIEEDLISEINDTGIGVMGMGGATTCLDVRIEWAMRHPASFPVGMIVQCYSHRAVSALINEKGEIAYKQE
jgi:fumarate hydratase subunit alpha